ncbi:MAG: hypothetical protein IH598_15010 [Bacteroidales bacterium]|nr:hypothetical protein [Bacteroidales bacterium]
MNITKEQTGDLTATLKLEIAEADYSKTYHDELKKFARQATIPGFRPGKVPMGMIEKKYGISILMEQINKMVNEELNNYIKNENLNVLGDPIPNGEKGMVNFETQKDFEFYFDIGLAPEFEVELSDNMKLDYYRIQATDEQIDKIIEGEQKRYPTKKEVEEVEKGVEIEFDLRELNNKGNLLDDGTFSPCKLLLDENVDEKMLNQLVGKKVNDILTVNAVELFGTLEHAEEKMGLDKKAIEANPNGYQMKITYIQKDEPSGLNEEFYEHMFPGKEISDEKAFRAEIARQIELYNEKESDLMLIADVMHRLTENANIQLPDEFMKRWLHFMNEGKFSQEDIAKDYVHLKLQLINDMIEGKLKSTYNELVISPEILKKEFKKQIASYFMYNAGMTEEEVDTITEKYANDWLKDEKHKEEVTKRRRQIYELRFAELIKSKITLEDVPLSPAEFYRISEEKYRQRFGDLMHEHDHEHDHNHDHDHDHEEIVENKSSQADEQ